MNNPFTDMKTATNDLPPGSCVYVVGISTTVAIGGFLFGFDSGVINGTVQALAASFGTQAAATGFAVASVLLGCALGAFGAGTLANRIGRRPTMLLGEMFSNRQRGAALGVAGATNWVANFSVTVSFLPLLKTIGFASAYCLYTLAAIVSVFFVWTAVRETKGKSLEEMPNGYTKQKPSTKTDLGWGT